MDHSSLSIIFKGTGTQPEHIEQHSFVFTFHQCQSFLTSTGKLFGQVCSLFKPSNNIGGEVTEGSIWMYVQVRSMLQAGDIEKIMDPTVVACHPNMDSVWKVAEIAIQSVEPRGVHRPVMRDVVRELRDAITLEFSGGGTMAHLQGSSTDVHGHHSPHGGPPYLDISENSSTFDSTLDPQAR